MWRMLCCAVIALAAFVANHAQARSATLILLNGRIWTESSKQPESEAVAVEGNMILSVGPSASIRKLADMVVLTDDIFRIQTTNLDKVRVYMTVFDGSVIYQQGGQSP